LTGSKAGTAQSIRALTAASNRDCRRVRWPGSTRGKRRADKAHLPRRAPCFLTNDLGGNRSHGPFEPFPISTPSGKLGVSRLRGRAVRRASRDSLSLGRFRFAGESSNSPRKAGAGELIPDSSRKEPCIQRAWDLHQFPSPNWFLSPCWFCTPAGFDAFLIQKAGRDFGSVLTLRCSFPNCSMPDTCHVRAYFASQNDCRYFGHA
jgi:hypothetical protein